MSPLLPKDKFTRSAPVKPTLRDAPYRTPPPRATKPGPLVTHSSTGTVFGAATIAAEQLFVGIAHRTAVPEVCASLDDTPPPPKIIGASVPCLSGFLPMKPV